MSASHDLTTLGVEDLLRLGGIRQTCASDLTCLAHGLHVPCEQCAVEDLTAVVCRTCGATLPTMPATQGGSERTCASVEQFRSTGRVPFAAEAEAAWRKEREAHEAAERAEEDARRAEEGRVARLRARRATTRSLGASAASMLVGAVLVWRSPLNALRVPGWGEPRWDWRLAYLGLCIAVWCVAVAPVLRMRNASPLHWATVSVGWPAFGALAALLVASPDGLSSFSGAANGALLGIPALAAAAFTMRCSGVAMHDEAPVGVPKGFRGLRSPWVWLGLLLTAVVNYMAVTGQVPFM